jgi:predicted nucleic acid-binding protein
MVDTNVLLAATDEGRAEHHDALTILNVWPAGDTTLCVSGQILREYLAVATRPADRNGLGLKSPDALGNVGAIRERTTLVAEDAKVTERLLRLLADVDCSGRQIHDANVIATMLVHGIGTVVTMNVSDFARFDRYVSLVRLLPRPGFTPSSAMAPVDELGARYPTAWASVTCGAEKRSVRDNLDVDLVLCR